MKTKILAIVSMIFALSLIKIQAQTDTIPPLTPVNVQGFGYEKDLAVEWYHNKEADLAGYKIYSKSGNNYVLLTTIQKKKVITLQRFR